MRLFIGIRPSEAILKDLLHLQNGLKGRLLSPQNLHLTLKFLGEVKGDEEIRVRLIQAQRFPVTVQVLNRLMAFPSDKNARVISVGNSDSDPTLHALSEFFGREERGFHPHITLARLPNPTRFEGSEVSPIHLPIERLTLFQSHLGKGAPVYEILGEFPLATAKDA